MMRIKTCINIEIYYCIRSDGVSCYCDPHSSVPGLIHSLLVLPSSPLLLPWLLASNIIGSQVIDTKTSILISYVDLSTMNPKAPNFDLATYPNIDIVKIGDSRNAGQPPLAWSNRGS